MVALLPQGCGSGRSGGVQPGADSGAGGRVGTDGGPVATGGTAGVIDGGAGGAGGHTAGAGGHTAGAGGGPGGAGGSPPPIANVVPGRRPLRRLTRVELGNTVRELIGAPVPEAALALLPNDWYGQSGFQVGGHLSTQADAQRILHAAEAIARVAVERLAQLMPAGCAAPDAAAADGCAERFIAVFSRRAFRRPVTAEEIDDLIGLYRKQRSSTAAPSTAAPAASYQDALRVVIATVLQLPDFHYRWEHPGRPRVQGGLIALDGWELASRLSYLLWASMPDEALFTAAASGELGNYAVLAQQVRRMLADPRSRDGIGEFQRQWFFTDALAERWKDSEVHPLYTPATPALLLAESDAFAAGVISSAAADGRLASLFGSSRAVLPPALGPLYGVTVAGGSGSQEVALDPKQRAGLHTRGAFLAAHADARLSSPIHRGITVLRRLMCFDLEPPAGIDIPALPTELRPGQTTREMVEQHTGHIECRPCHSLINSIGFAFEHYDAIGVYRETDNGKPVDASGRITLDGGERNFANAIELGKILATSSQVQTCLTRHLLRYQLFRREIDSEEPAVAAALRAAGPSVDLRELLLALTQTRAFTHRLPSLQEIVQ